MIDCDDCKWWWLWLRKMIKKGNLDGVFLVAEGLLHHSSNLFWQHFSHWRCFKCQPWNSGSWQCSFWSCLWKSWCDSLQAEPFCNSLSKLLMRAATEWHGSNIITTQLQSSLLSSLISVPSTPFTRVYDWGNLNGNIINTTTIISIDKKCTNNHSGQ